MTARPEILFLAHRIPYPPDKGDKIRSWRLVEHLAKRFRVHLAAFVDDPRDFAHEAHLKSVCESLFLRPLDPATARLRSLSALLAEEPLSFAYYRDARMARHVTSLRRRGLAATFVFSSTMAPYTEEREGAPLIVDLCDADAEKWRAYADAAPFPLGAIYAREARRLADAETAILNRADVSFAVNESEAAILNDRPGVKRAAMWFGNGVDTAYFRPDAARSAPDPSADVVFTGAMDYHPNIDAVLWFAREAWPRVRARAPGARFAIVGARPARRVRALDGREGVIVTGRVDDVRPFLQHAAAVVAPMRIARGVQNKVLEAMAMARPVVATGAALEGVAARDGEEAIVANAPDAFAASVLLLLADRKRGDAIGASARARMKADYAWPAQFARLDGALAGLGL